MSFMVINAAQYLGRTFDNGHCVRFVQMTGNVPHTSTWRRGAKVRGTALGRGTVIATFGGTPPRYENRTDGSSHVAVLEGEEDVGLAVIDCWVGQPVARRIIRFRDGSGSAVNDGDQFYVVETTEPNTV